MKPIGIFIVYLKLLNGNEFDGNDLLGRCGNGAYTVSYDYLGLTFFVEVYIVNSFELAAEIELHLCIVFVGVEDTNDYGVTVFSHLNSTYDVAGTGEAEKSIESGKSAFVSLFANSVGSISCEEVCGVNSAFTVSLLLSEGNEGVFNSEGTLALCIGSGEVTPVTKLVNASVEGERHGVFAVAENFVFAETATCDEETAFVVFETEEGGHLAGLGGVGPAIPRLDNALGDIELTFSEEYVGFDAGLGKNNETMVFSVVVHYSLNIESVSACTESVFGFNLHNGFADSGAGLEISACGNLHHVSYAEGDGSFVCGNEFNLSAAAFGGNLNAVLGLTIDVFVTDITGVFENTGLVFSAGLAVDYGERTVSRKLYAEASVSHSLLVKNEIGSGLGFAVGLNSEGLVTESGNASCTEGESESVSIERNTECILGKNVVEYYAEVFHVNCDLLFAVEDSDPVSGNSGILGKVEKNGNSFAGNNTVGIEYGYCIFTSCSCGVNLCHEGVGFNLCDFLTCSENLLESGNHFGVNIVNGASADGVVRMVLEEVLPHEGEVVAADLVICTEIRKYGHGFDLLFEEGFALCVELLEVDTCGSGVCESVPAGGIFAVQFTYEDTETVSVRTDGIEVILVVRVDDFIGEGFVNLFDNLTYIGLNGLMVAAVEEELVRSYANFVHAVAFLGKELFSFCGIGGDFVCVVVPVHEYRTENFGTVGRTPLNFGNILTVVFFAGVKTVALSGRSTATESNGVNAEAAEDLRTLTDVAECIREVTGVGNGAVLCSNLLTNDHVADIGFAVNEEFVLKDVPGTAYESAFSNVLFDLFAHLGANFEIVFYNDGLTVEVEALEAGIVVESFKELVKELDETETVGFEGHVPFAVPVGVRNNVKCFLIHCKPLYDRI